ncbi:glycosyltransferase family 2 protein [Pseudohoeflea coraliihabitans]|uniref:Glycosyltransferase n=1 Tax=Pseudohoeflea coraliihabitans TaxID=2860393 RepID=A0ABS6WNH6_9HYPH|nr:glycosyltransferase [Pseudohoeflea sp. DP4N28-3]MBW3097516.1 glycosyltransferase [Pseudohoeflea sp. DP4N28-3]
MAIVAMLATGSVGYAFAARQAVQSVLAWTDFDIHISCDDVGALLLPHSPRIHLHHLQAITNAPRGAHFLEKFTALEAALAASDDDLILMLDVDAMLVRPITHADLDAYLGICGIAMAEQNCTIPDGTSREDLFRHYRQVSLPAVLRSETGKSVPGSQASAPDLATFRYHNAGVALFRRAALTEFLAWARAIERRHPDVARYKGRLIADQDFLQVWCNSVRPGICAELPATMNHCALWHGDFPRPDAAILHFSNYCNGPTFETLFRLKQASAAYPPPPAPETPHRALPAGQAHEDEAAAQPAELTIIIVTCNSAAVLPHCLEFLTPYKCPVIVVDNGSHDDSIALATAAGASVIPNAANLGFARAANIGAAAAKTAYLCFLNPDCLLTEKVLAAALAQFSRREPGLYVPRYREWSGRCVEGRQPGYTRLKLLSDMLATGRRGLRGSLGRRLSRAFAHLPMYHDRSWHWPLAACLFASADDFRRIGGFDERFWLYMEDVWLGRMAARLGVPTRALACDVAHFSAKGAAVDDTRRARYLNAARLTYARLAFGPVSAALCRWLAPGGKGMSRSPGAAL